MRNCVRCGKPKEPYPGPEHICDDLQKRPMQTPPMLVMSPKSYDALTELTNKKRLRTDKEVKAMLERLGNDPCTTTHKIGVSYEQGVRDTIAWIYNSIGIPQPEGWPWDSELDPEINPALR